MVNFEYYPAPLLCGVAALFGLMIGSFLNVIIHRLPKMLEQQWMNSIGEALGEVAENPTLHAQVAPLLAAQHVLQQAAQHSPPLNLARPRSRCPHCNTAISALENIPVLSFLCLRGKCRHCKASISIRYPLVELASATLAGLAVWQFGLCNGLLLYGLLAALLVAALIDADMMLLPDEITYPVLWAGLLINTLGTFTPLPSAVIGAAAGYLLLWSVFWVFKLLTGREGMGRGDFVLLAALGAWLGWAMLPQILLFASLAGLLLHGGMMLLQRRDRTQALPFGPYLAAGGALSIFFGNIIATL